MPARSLARVIGVCSAALLLTGCKETVEQSLTVYPDQTSDVSVMIGVDDEAWTGAPPAARTGDRLGSGSAAAHLRAEVQRDGGSLSLIDGPDRHGTVIKARALTDEQVQALLLAVWSFISIGSTQGQVRAETVSYHLGSRTQTDGGTLRYLELTVPTPPAGAPIVVTTRVTVPGADSTEFEHPVRDNSERPFRDLPITQSRESDLRRSAATSRRLGDTSPPPRMA